jgi:hypothetical protein
MKRLVISLDVEGIAEMLGDLIIVFLDQADLETIANTVRHKSISGWHNPITDPLDRKRLREKATVYDTGLECYLTPNSSVFLGITLPDGDTIGNCLEVNGYCWIPEEIRIPPGEEMIDAGLLVECVGQSLRFMFRDKQSGTWTMTKAITIRAEDVSES